MTQYRKDRIFCWCVAALLGFICICSTCTYLSTNLRTKASVYEGNCVNTYISERETGSRNRGLISDFVMQMEDGQEFWVSSSLCNPGFFDKSAFREAAKNGPVTIYYVNDHPMNLGSHAKEAVEIHVGDEVLLSMDDVIYARRITRTYFWAVFSVIAIIYIWVEFSNFMENRHLIRQRRKKKRVKAQRREWLDAHPEEKGAPPSARRKKDRR